MNDVDAREYIDNLDLEYIVEAMCSPNYPLPRWTKDDAQKCCRLYKDFLILKKIHRGVPLVPTREIDEFWHNHILYTKEYVNDCMKIFGHYLHHQPASPTENPDEMVKAYLKTKQLYLDEFKRPLSLI